MKPIIRFMHLNLIAVMLMAAMGFRVDKGDCAAEPMTAHAGGAKSSCCCAGKKAPVRDDAGGCQDNPCVIRVAYPQVADKRTAAETPVAIARPKLQPVIFIQEIRPALLAAEPHYILPPPYSGRFIGILHQTFLI